MALRDRFRRLTQSVEDQDREKLQKYVGELAGVTEVSCCAARANARVAGEVTSIRIVPRAGSPSLEVTVNDGTGNVVGIFLGRRKISGMSPGRKILFEGTLAREGRYCAMWNPAYEFLA